MVFTLDRLHIRCEDCISTPPEGMTAQTFGVIFTQIVMNTEVVQCPAFPITHLVSSQLAFPV